MPVVQISWNEAFARKVYGVQNRKVSQNVVILLRKPALY